MRRKSAEGIAKHDEHRSRHRRRRRRCCATGRHIAPEKASSKKGASKKKAALKGQKNAKAKSPAVARRKEATASKKAARLAHATQAATPRADSKASKILVLIGRSKGATLTEIMAATDWQSHSVRGFLSTAAKKRGLKIESTKTETGERTYRIAK